MKLKECIATLKKARKSAQMESASFDNIRMPPKSLVKHEDGRPVTEATVTEFIRERTRIYVDSWIIGRIDEAIKELEQARKLTSDNPPATPYAGLPPRQVKRRQP